MARGVRCRRLLCAVGKVEEPGKVVENDEEARRNELDGRQGDERPGAAEVLEVDDMAEDAKEDEMEWERVREVEEDVEGDDNLRERTIGGSMISMLCVS